MTTKKLKARLAAMSPTQKQEFKTALGQPNVRDDDLVRDFNRTASLQEDVCHSLGVKSQAQKLAAATIANLWLTCIVLLISVGYLIVSILK